MSKNFLIGGTIIDDSSEAWAFEDVTPSQVRAVIGKLEPGEDITFDISSPGGSVTAGIAIANMIREAKKCGHDTKAHVVGIAASIASVIACACDEVEMDASAFMMIHNPWTVAQGDAEELRKSADVLDQMKQAILSFYRGKFEKTDAELTEMMDAETWFTGEGAADMGFKCAVLTNDEPLKVAACAREIPGFAKMPESAAKLFALAQAKEKVRAEATESEPAVVIEPTAEPKAEETAPAEAEVAPEEAQNIPEAEKPQETAPEAAEVAPEAAPVEPQAKDEFTVRLAAAMKSRDGEINRLKEANAELQRKSVAMIAEMEKNFKDQLEAAGKELMTAKAEVTRLAGELETAKNELTDKSSALEAKETALAMLNARVNREPEERHERSYAEIVNDPKATPTEKLEAAKKELAKRNSKI